MKIDGACLCGYLRYEADINPDRVAICHCTSCQTESASAFRVAVLVRKENFKLLAGTPKIYVKSSEAGRPRALSFCPECGTALHGSDPVDTKWYSLRLGTARQRAELPPKIQIWCRSRLPWLAGLSTAREMQTQGEPPK